MSYRTLNNDVTIVTRISAARLKTGKRKVEISNFQSSKYVMISKFIGFYIVHEICHHYRQNDQNCSNVILFDWLKIQVFNHV